MGKPAIVPAMAQSQPTRATKRAMRTRRRSLKAVVKGQGRSFVWLAAQTGYSTTQISRVARGEHPGSTRFHIAMRSALGEDYAA